MRCVLLMCFLIFGNVFAQNNPFITEWVTSNGLIVIPTNASSGPYNYNLKYYQKNDSVNTVQTRTNLTENDTIANLSLDTFVVEITGVFPHFYLNNESAIKDKLKTIVQWGNIQWKSFENAFQGASFVQSVANDVPSLGQTTTLDKAFYNASLFNQDLSTWNISNIISMADIFENSGMSYCNMDFTLNGWATNLIANSYAIGAVPKASNRSQAIVGNLGSRINVIQLVSTTNAVSVSHSGLQCYGNEIVITANTSATSQIIWGNQSTDNPISLILENDTFITVIAIDSVNCFTYDTLSLIANPLPQVQINSIPNASTVCPGDTINLYATGADSYLWNTGETMTGIYVINASQTTYFVTGTDATTGCKATEYIDIDVFNTPIVTITATEIEVCKGKPTTLIAEGLNLVSFDWITGEQTKKITVNPTENTNYIVVATDTNGCVSKANINITVKECVGLAENNIYFSVFPNPATEYFTIHVQNIDLSNASVVIMDLTGKKLSNTKLTEENTKISVANYPNGVYFIKVQAGKNVNVEKIIKH